MLDQIEKRIARDLADHHNYPYGQEIYNSIFKAFSYFPLKLKEMEIKGEGKTITFMAMVVLHCLEFRERDIFNCYRALLERYQKTVAPGYPQDISVETFLGCLLYTYHPVDLRSAFSNIDVTVIFDKKQQYEYELKKKTILIYAI
jgi:hypothetical protein